MLKYIKDTDEKGEVESKYDARETLIHATTQEDISALLADDYEVDDDRFPDPEIKPRNIGKMTNPYKKRDGNGI